MTVLPPYSSSPNFDDLVLIFVNNNADKGTIIDATNAIMKPKYDPPIPICNPYNIIAERMRSEKDSITLFSTERVGCFSK